MSCTASSAPSFEPVGPRHRQPGPLAGADQLGVTKSAPPHQDQHVARPHRAHGHHRHPADARCRTIRRIWAAMRSARSRLASRAETRSTGSSHQSGSSSAVSPSISGHRSTRPGISVLKATCSVGSPAPRGAVTGEDPVHQAAGSAARTGRSMRSSSVCKGGSAVCQPPVEMRHHPVEPGGFGALEGIDRLLLVAHDEDRPLAGRPRARRRR